MADQTQKQRDELLYGLYPADFRPKRGLSSVREQGRRNSIEYLVRIGIPRTRAINLANSAIDHELR